MPFAPDTFASYASRSEWLGWGYIGERRAALEMIESRELAGLYRDRVIRADRMALQYAADAGWTDADLFEWANSKAGRWFAELAFAGAFDSAARYLRRPQA